MKNSANACCAVCILLTPLAVQAAPVDAGDDASISTTSARPAERYSAPSVQGYSRTVDLLIEMQNKKAGLSFDERTRPLDRTLGSSAAGAAANKSTAAPLSNNGSGMFGSGVNTAVVGKELTMASGDWKLLPAPGVGRGSTGQGPEAEKPRDSETGGRMPMFGELLQFVRNNRTIVGVLAISALVLVWAGSAVASQRRR